MAEKMGLQNKRILTLAILAVFSFLNGVNILYGQESTFDTVLLCFVPENLENEVSDRPTEFLFDFSGNHFIGFSPGEAGKFTIYSNKTVIAAVYQIRHDAQSGGYRRVEKIREEFANIYTSSQKRPCNVSLENPDGLLSTTSLPVLDQQAVMVQTDEVRSPSLLPLAEDTSSDQSSQLNGSSLNGLSPDDFLDKKPIANSIGFYLEPDIFFEILTLDGEGRFFLKLPFISKLTRFIVVANQNIEVNPGAGDVGGGEGYENAHRFLEDQGAGRNLATVLRDGGFHIFPQFSTTANYKPDNTIEFEVPNSLPSPRWRVNEGSRVRPLYLPDIRVPITLIDESVAGTTRFISTNEDCAVTGVPQYLEVVGLDNQGPYTGQLRVKSPDEQIIGVIDVWLTVPLETNRSSCET